MTFGRIDRQVHFPRHVVQWLDRARFATTEAEATPGTDATTTCVTIARAATGRRKILVAKGAYHAAVPWCLPSLLGVSAEDRAHLVYFTFNDVEGLEAAAKTAGDDLAGILVSAFRHDFGFDQELPTAEFARAARRICDGINWRAFQTQDARCVDVIVPRAAAQRFKAGP